MGTSSTLRKQRHCVFNLHVHLVFVTKYRYGVSTLEALENLGIFLRLCAGILRTNLLRQAEEWDPEWGSSLLPTHIRFYESSPERSHTMKQRSGLPIQSCFLKLFHPVFCSCSISCADNTRSISSRIFTAFSVLAIPRINFVSACVPSEGAASI